MALKYGGKTISDYSAMRGPCLEGFHVPLVTEWVGLKTIMTSLSLTTGNSWRINLHMPFVGARNYSGGAVYSQGTYAYYWSSSLHDDSYPEYAKLLAFGSGYVNPVYYIYRAYGFPVRSFKDLYATPDSTWTTVQGTLGSAGIFWNQTEGLISITDGSAGYTIMDKNLGATAVYNDGDALTQANMGNMYQWGNNYGFQSTGSVITSSTQVDASNYGPGNYYNSSIFIIGNNDWSSIHNDNLRGGVTGIKQKPVDIVERYYGGKLVDDYSAMRGPCPEGFHVPTALEFSDLHSAGQTIGAWGPMNTQPIDLIQLITRLKLPQTNSISYSGSVSTGLGVYYTCSTVSDPNRPTSYSFGYDYASLTNSENGYGHSIRPFKDAPVAPDNTWTTIYDGSSAATGAGIFWSAARGLISVSADGENWITIADKNCGATVVYNYGDTIDETNGGKLYQWGNNYGFPYTGPITTSSTLIDVSSYGPSEYSSDVFITQPTWRTGSKKDLWGVVTGVQQRPAKVTEVYYGSTKIRPLSFNN